MGSIGIVLCIHTYTMGSLGSSMVQITSRSRQLHGNTVGILIMMKSIVMAHAHCLIVGRSGCVRSHHNGQDQISRAKVQHRRTIGFRKACTMPPERDLLHTIWELATIESFGPTVHTQHESRWHTSREFLNMLNNNDIQEKRYIRQNAGAPGNSEN